MNVIQTNSGSCTANDVKVNAYSDYSQSVHMYICIEALKLLKDHFPGQNFSAFESKIGTMDNTGTRPWQMGRVTTGAYREDVEDVVFGIRGPFDFFVSCSHFWNADNRTNGDHSLTTLNIFGFNHDYPNAFTKINNFVSGDWREWNGNGYGARKFIEYNNTAGYVYRFSLHHTGLIEFFRTKRIWLESTVNYLGQVSYFRDFVTVPENLRDIICWEIVGRICHLIQDLTIAAHAHNDVHANVPGIGGDCYHDFIDGGGFGNYSWLTAKNNGGFINPYEADSDPLRYLTYSAVQLADHYPSGPDCLEIPQQHLGNNNLPGGSYPIIDNYYQLLGPPPSNITNVYETGRYCFNHAIRATASLLYWFGVETGLITTEPHSIPRITGFSKNLPDYMLYRGETLITTVNAEGPDLNYDWFIKVCDTNTLCSNPIPGIQTLELANSFYLTNTDFRNYWTCPKYDTLCHLGGGSLPFERPLHFKIGVRVYNQYGSVTKYFNPSEFFNPLQSLRPPPNISGCPFLLVKVCDRYVYENNMLNKNSFTININKDTEDKYFLNTTPYIDYDSKTINLALKETDRDIDYFDRVSLIAVDHPENTNAGIDLNNNIVLYFTEDITSPIFAEHNGYDVTDKLLFDTLITESVRGIEKDNVNLKFPAVIYENKISEYSEDSIALIIDPFHCESVPDPGAYKREAGQITAFDSEGNIKSGIQDFAIREIRSQEIIPLFKSNSISSAEISWKRGFDISYAAMTRVYYGGYLLKTLELSEAIDFRKGNVKELVLETDNYYAESDSSTFIELKFKIPDYGPAPGMKRNYLYIINGKYLRENIFSEKTILNISDKQLQNSNKENNLTRLIGNFPNPFNPVTTIKYSISGYSGKLVKVRLVVYDITGKEIMELVNAFQGPGNYFVNLNAESLSSGIYYSILQTDNYIEAKKMTVLK